MNHISTYSVGDSAITADLELGISKEANQKIIAMGHWLWAHPFTGMKDIVPAYSSLTVYFDPLIIKKTYQPEKIHTWVEEKLQEAYRLSPSGDGEKSVLHEIPVCYDEPWSPDMEAVCAATGLRRNEVIQLHCSAVYRVYMIGFMPGFAYLGKLPDALITSRKQKPAPVTAGAVAIAGSQTGIYPLDSPGGWNIIGHTHLQLFSPQSDKPVWLEAGDEVRFFPVERNDELRIKNK